MPTVRVEALTDHRCPVTGMWRVWGEVFDLPASRVAARVRAGAVRIMEEQA